MDEHLKKAPEKEKTPETRKDGSQRIIVDDQTYQHVGSVPSFTDGIVWLKWVHDQKVRFQPLPGSDGWQYAKVQGKNMYNKECESIVATSAEEVHLYQINAKTT